MVLESLINPFRAKKRPWELFFYGFFVASIAVFLGYWIFRDKADLVMIFLTVFACVPLMFNTIRNEEKEDLISKTEEGALREHSKVMALYLFLFLGITVAYVVWFVFLPGDMSASLFGQQVKTIEQINTPISGQFVGGVTSTSLFNRILINNVKVLVFCLIFSFFYGAGAIFILSWNASVVAAAIGMLIKTGLIKYGALAGGSKVVAVGYAVSFSFSRYFLHGLPEMLAYMVAGLAGGIISVAVINHDFGTEKFQKVIFDSSILIIVAVAILFIAAIMESFLTPALF